MNFSPLQNEKLQAFSDSLVEHSQVQTIFSDFDDLRMNRHLQADQQCMLLTGDTGVGKSHLINHYRKRVLASQKFGRERVPILISRISSNQGLDATLINMISDLELFGSAHRKKRGYQTDLVKKLVNSLIRAEVELLIINEFQELIEYKTQRERQAIANVLKFISEEAKVPIVLVGMPWAEQIANEPQWSSRLVRRRRLDYFSIVNDRSYYMQYLKGLALHMPFDTPPKLEYLHMAVPLFAATHGENRALKHLLLEVIKIAFIQNAVMLDIGHFAQAYSKLSSLQLSPEKVLVNPFTQNINDIEICEYIELSKYLPDAAAPIPRKLSPPQTLSDISQNINWNKPNNSSD
jgi:hypothetical protein